jgi:hypothetical protein
MRRSKSLELSRLVAKESKVYLSVIDKLEIANLNRSLRWPIFRFFSDDLFLVSDEECLPLRETSPETVDLLNEYPDALRDLGVKESAKDLLLASTEMGSRLVLTNSTRSFYVSYDFHGLEHRFDSFEDFFVWEIKQELDAIEVGISDVNRSGYTKSSSEYINTLMVNFDPEKMYKIKFG